MMISFKAFQIFFLITWNKFFFLFKGICGKTEVDCEFLDVKLSHTVGNMMNEILFGIHYDEDDKDWIKIQKLREAGIKGEFHKNSKKMFFYDYLRKIRTLMVGALSVIQ